ncbi:hypothetical protein, partial [Pseudomonas sp. PA-3-6E]|uniref:hypothetical protein n=1 Tax=Pseudomonas sp. PA-3-6E TaxID=2665474 RepID=UPI001F29224A
GEDLNLTELLFFATGPFFTHFRFRSAPTCKYWIYNQYHGGNPTLPEVDFLQDQAHINTPSRVNGEWALCRQKGTYLFSSK